ncbi:MAG TPA: hypothetical protein VJJ28_01205 [Candidatus Paceibacterota bacterium]
MIVFVSCLFLMRLSFFNIKNIVIDGIITVSTNDIEEKVLAGLQGQYFSIIPKSNIFLYPKKHIERLITDSFKEIDYVYMKRKDISSLNISIKERMPSAIVCSGFYTDNSSGEGNSCYFSDKNAYLYSKVPSSQTSSQLKKYNYYYISDDENEITTGMTFVNKERFEALQDFIDGALRGGIFPLGILIGDEGEYEMYMENKTNRNSNISSEELPEVTVYFDDKWSFDFTLSNLLTFWKNTIDKSKNSNIPVFDYINLRFGNTIYYSTQ